MTSNYAFQREASGIGLGRPPAQLHVSHEGRKPLFAKSQESSRLSLGGEPGPRPAIADISGGSGSALARRKSTNDFGFRGATASVRDPPPAAAASSTAAAAAAAPTVTTGIVGANTSTMVSPGGSRIPQPSSLGGLSKRRPISLAEAFRMAQGEEDFGAGDDSDGGIDHNSAPSPVDGSPSPAPRPWRMRHTLDESQLRKLGAMDMLGKGQPPSGAEPGGALADKDGGEGGHRDVHNGITTNGNNNNHNHDNKNKSNGNGNGNGKINNNGDNQNHKEAGSSLGSSLRSPAVGTSRFKSLDSIKIQSQTATSSSPRISQLRSARTSLVGGSVALPELVSWIDETPSVDQRPTRIPSPLYTAAGAGSGSGAGAGSPEKSFAWDVDEDFTAGELQVSESPRLRVGRHMFESRLAYDDNGRVSLTSGLKLPGTGTQNTKLEDIRSREMQTGGNIPLERPTPRTYVSKLDQIRARETQAEQQIPIPSRHLDRLRNTKLDEIRQLEEKGLSRRAYAAARLKEIKDMNQMTRFHRQTEEPPRPPSSKGLYDRYNKDPVPESINFGAARPRAATAYPASNATATATAAAGEDPGGRSIPDTPVTIFRGHSRRSNSDGSKNGIQLGDDITDAAAAKIAIQKEAEAMPAVAPPPPSQGPAGPAAKASDEEDFEWVRRLARAASSSPAVADPKTCDAQLPSAPVETGSRRNSSNQSRADTVATLRLARRKSDAEATEKPVEVQRLPATERVSDSDPAHLDGTSGRDERKSAIAPSVTDLSEPAKPSSVLVALAPSHRPQPSVSSVRSSKSNMQSEIDPTDRIEGEMKLFAPADNQSERGSVRAPSPLLLDSDEEEDEKKKKNTNYTNDDYHERADDATPKPTKPDPLSMPTPRVTGAYVETPVTQRVDRRSSEDPVEVRPRTRFEDKPAPATAAALRERRASLASRRREQDAGPEPRAADDSDIGTTTSAAVRRRPRAKSLPRRRPPVKNSARPPSVKDDLLQLQRAYDVEDSTFDDLDEILSGRKPLTSRRDGLPKDLLAGSNGDDPDFDFDIKTKQPSVAVATTTTTAAAAAAAVAPSPKRSSPRREKNKVEETEASSGELAALDRMNKSLRTGILGIRTAKQGIERLEGQISQANKQSSSPPPPAATGPKPAPVEKAPTRPEVKAEEDDSSSSKIPPADEKDRKTRAQAPKPASASDLPLAIPRLFHRKPQFRLTLLGVLVLVLSVWCASESAMCSMYCRPSTCAASRAPCAWSYDDPAGFGTALPIKLDQWVTGGRGREMLSHVVDEALDWVAEVEDLVRGRDITEINVEKLSFEGRRRHRRRLRKKGLGKPAPKPDAETKAKWDAWHQTRMAKQRAREMRDKGFAGEDETGSRSASSDQHLW
ncbi:hypothetical protein ESCO_002039 [Escovopsis weberi]|uniref:Uncharacterized protein n=1 Tax=Escovopsis weberi TaxID=150374 RepID=A0A0M9VW95_ESCWE|nr:hypothetical protein ESCO_002039 [Escovopsis weberi]